MLKGTFIQLLSKYTNDDFLTNDLWSEIELLYLSKERYYHTLQHLDNLLVQLTEIKSDIKNWETTLFALYYHDIIYNPQNSDNEEKSAELAGQRMRQIAVPHNTITLSAKLILATKSHLFSTDSDTNYFTDADLSILGHDSETYALYSSNVRKEYSMYPDSVYNPGRKSVLKHFLSMDRIFKTDFFYNKFEAQARKNLTNELNNANKGLKE